MWMQMEYKRLWRNICQGPTVPFCGHSLGLNSEHNWFKSKFKKNYRYLSSGLGANQTKYPTRKRHAWLNIGHLLLHVTPGPTDPIPRRQLSCNLQPEWFQWEFKNVVIVNIQYLQISATVRTMKYFSRDWRQYLKMPRHALQCQRKWQKTTRSIPLSRSDPEDNGVYSRLREILHPSFVEICSAVFV